VTGALLVLTIVAFVCEGMQATVKGYRPRWWAFGIAAYLLAQAL
jgi:hypothetical protein